MVQIHEPDTCHTWGIESHVSPRGTYFDATSFVCACRKILMDKTLFPEGTWFHQSGFDTSPNFEGYQFFEYMGPAPEETVRKALTLVRQELALSPTPYSLLIRRYGRLVSFATLQELKNDIKRYFTTREIRNGIVDHLTKFDKSTYHDGYYTCSYQDFTTCFHPDDEY